MQSTATGVSSVEPRAALSDRLALQPRPPNLLIIGTAERTSAFIVGVLPVLDEPIDFCQARDFLPRARSGVLILHDALEMPAAPQAALLAWLDSAERTRVVTIVSAPLFPKVTAGLFLAALYYRLNTVTVDLNEDADARASDASRQILAV